VKTEIIIAARGELEANLRRTVTEAAQEAPVAVVIDGQENKTPDGLPARIVSSPWRRPRGCGQARHMGITTSSADVVVLTDGHMTFPPGWIATIEKHLEANPEHLTCCRMQSLRQDWTPFPDAPENGAFLALKSRERAGEFWAISAKWAKGGPESGPVSAVMGACYGFTRAWYERIGRPLSILEAWGQDEEILSLATHLMGGRVFLLPVIVGHIYMAAHAGRMKTADESALIWSNRYAVLDALPMPAEERAELRAWMKRTARIGNETGDHFTEERATAIRKLHDRLASGPRTWGQLKADGIVRPLTDAEQARCLDSTTLRDDARRGARASLHEPMPPRPVQCPLCDRTQFQRVPRSEYVRCLYCNHKMQGLRQ